MRIGLLQLNATVGDFSANLAKVRKAYADAVAQGAELVLAPELFLCGYPPRDLLLRQDFISQNLTALHELAETIGSVPLCIGYVDKNEDRPGKALRNAAAVLQNGKITHRIFKSLLPTYDVFDEDRYFEPAASTTPVIINGKKIALTICEDIWNDQDFWPERLYRRDPVADLIQSGAELVVNLSASPWHLGKEQQRLSMLQRVARDEKIPLIQVNTVGANDELIFDGHSVALNAKGEVIALGKGFTEEVLVVDTNAASAAPVAWPTPPDLLFQALALGIRDYVLKCGFQSVVLGLSGGIDSAVVAVLAAAALGPDKVMGVSLPSRYSSSGSLSDAEALARNLGIRYEVISIESSFNAVETQLKPIFEERKPDLTEENMQSRLRGLILMALSNKFGSLVLTTGNKSEMAVGYCTLYGDMCGALAVIADVFKTQVYDLARWINREKEIIPIDTITKPPSAELRPDQKDQDSLPEYDLLDQILDLYIVRDLPKPVLVEKGFPENVVSDVINKVNFSEYKRRQAAPGLKVSPRAFGVGRRIPVAQRFRT